MLAYPVSEEDVPDSHEVICAPRLRQRSQAAPKTDDTCEGVISWDRIDPTIGGLVDPARAPRQQEAPPRPVHEHLALLQPALTATGLRLLPWRRDWDSTVWPLATAGFFKVRQRIPRLLVQLHLG